MDQDLRDRLEAFFDLVQSIVEHNDKLIAENADLRNRLDELEKTVYGNVSKGRM